MSQPVVRSMRDDEFGDIRAVSMAAFDDPHIGDLLDALRASWAWADELSFVAETPTRSGSPTPSGSDRRRTTG